MLNDYITGIKIKQSLCKYIINKNQEFISVKSILLYIKVYINQIKTLEGGITIEEKNLILFFLYTPLCRCIQRDMQTHLNKHTKPSENNIPSMIKIYLVCQGHM